MKKTALSVALFALAAALVLLVSACCCPTSSTTQDDDSTSPEPATKTEATPKPRKVKAPEPDKAIIGYWRGDRMEGGKNDGASAEGLEIEFTESSMALKAPGQGFSEVPYKVNKVSGNTVYIDDNGEEVRLEMEGEDVLKFSPKGKDGAIVFKRARGKMERPPKPDVTVSALQLFKDYDANEVAADEKYKGKMLLVDGVVTGIDKDFLDNIVIQLKSTNQFMPTRATMEPSEKSQAAKLSKGNKVKVLCKCQGKLVGSPSLDDCIFQ